MAIRHDKSEELERTPTILKQLLVTKNRDSTIIEQFAHSNALRGQLPTDRCPMIHWGILFRVVTVQLIKIINLRQRPRVNEWERLQVTYNLVAYKLIS